MMKTNILRAFSITVLLFAVSSCGQNQPNSGGAATAEDTNASGQATATPPPASASAASSKLEGGAPVPAKRENLTADDRAAFLRGIGLTEYADASPRFVEWMAEMYGEPQKNAGMTFHSLGGGSYLVETMVDMGANQSASVYALYQENAAGKATAKLLEMDDYRGNGKVVKTSGNKIIGAPKFNEQTKVLTITALARGIGGCGDQTKYKIVGDRAEIIEVRYQECSDYGEILPPEKWALMPLEKGGDGGAVLNDEDFQQMSPAHAEFLKGWLRLQKIKMRPVRDDKTSASSQKDFREDNPNKDPFYAVGDFNNNGVEDFAVILTPAVPKISPETKRKLNALAVFEMSPANTGNQPKADYFDGGIDSLFIITGTLDAEGIGKNILGIASYPSDDGFLLVPKGKTYTLKPMVDF